MPAKPASKGRWLIARYAPVTLFSLKASFATSSVGSTLVLPTPYAIKMALVDAAFRAGWEEGACASLLQSLAEVPLRIAPPEAVVTHTFYKVRQEPKKPTPEEPYISNVAYREFAAHHGEWRWAFQVADEDGLGEQIRALLPYVRYIGKRGSFIQFMDCRWEDALGPEYTVPLHPSSAMRLPERCHVLPLDDFGPDACLEVLSSFTDAKPKRDRHRKFVETLVPLARIRTGPGFTEYRA